MKKINLLIGLALVLCLIGCDINSNLTLSSVEKELYQAESPNQTETPFETSLESSEIDIVGDWNICYAENGNTKENYPLQNLYGTGLERESRFEISF